MFGKIPLAYVVQKSSAVEPINDALLRLNPSTLLYAGKYNCFHDKIIERASHSHPSFAEDSALVLDVVKKIERYYAYD